MLLPNNSPIAISAASKWMAKIEVTSSGKEVTKATSVVPMKVVPNPVVSAISLLERTMIGVAMTRITDAARNKSKGRHVPGGNASFFFSVPAGCLCNSCFAIINRPDINCNDDHAVQSHPSNLDIQVRKDEERSKSDQENC